MRLPAVLAWAVLGGMGLPGAIAPAHAQSFEVVYVFPGGRHGEGPSGGVTYYQGHLLGTTAYGGNQDCDDGCGIVYSLGRTTGKERVVYEFQGGATDTSNPQGNLASVGGILYGTTTYGGLANRGTVYSVDPHTRAEKIVYSFKTGADAQLPIANLLNVAGTLYGVTLEGGTAGNGAVFSIDVATGVEKVVHSFQDSGQGNLDGARPMGGVVEFNGMLYGTTANGGDQGDGTVYSLDPTTGVDVVLHSFGRNADGEQPESSLIKIRDKLYGTALFGGSHNAGTVFSLTPSTGRVGVIYSFKGVFKGGSDGFEPWGGLINANGVLYGTTARGGIRNCGGNLGCGTVFSLDLASKAETVVHAFDDNDGGGTYPLPGLTSVGGMLYGTTGGNNGTVFAITP